MPNIDFFQFFRYTLGTVVTIYATIVTLQGLWTWYVMLAGSHRYIGIARRYLIVHGLRLRFTAFWGDVMICLLLCIACVLIWKAHSEIGKTGAAYREVKRLQIATNPPR